MRDNSLSARTVRNAAWVGSSQAVRQVIAFLTTLFVARLLQPSDYGIFAMTLFVNELAQLVVDFGIGSALVQHKNVDRRMLSTCFWINVVVGVLAGAGVIVSGPIAAAYFHQPLVAHLLFVSAANLCVSSFAVIPQAVLARELAFRHIAIGTSIGSLVGAASTVAMAFYGFGVWALVFQPLIGTSVNLVYLLVRAHWRPTFEFELAAVRGVVRFSSHMLVGNLLNHVSRNLPHLILAPAMGPAATGLMAMAQTLAWMPIAQFTATIVRVTYPAFAKIQDSRDRLWEALKKSMELVALLAFPVLVGLAVLSADVVVVVFGEHWRHASPIVAIFSVVSMVHSVTFLSGNTLLATGRSDLSMKLSLLTLPVLGAALWFTRDRSLVTASVAMATVLVAVALVGLWVAGKNLGVTLRQLAAPVIRTLGASALMALVLLALGTQLDHLSPPVRLAVQVCTGALTYLSLTWIVNRQLMIGAIGMVKTSLAR